MTDQHDDIEHNRIISESDQTLQLYIEVFPPRLRAIYEAFLAQEFTDYQAFELTKIYYTDVNRCGES